MSPLLRSPATGLAQQFTWQRYLLLFVLNLLVTSEFWSLYVTMSDEGISVVCAQRILQGELPYRDFETDITPGIYLVSAAWYALVGVSNFSIRFLVSLISASTSVLVQACAERVLSGYWRYLPWLLWTTGGIMDFPIVNHHWLGGAFVTLSWYFLLRWCSQNDLRTRLGLGLSLALSLWALQSEGLAATLATIFVWLRLRPSGLGQVILAAVGGSLLIWLPLLPYFHQILGMNVTGIAYHVSDSYSPLSLRNLRYFLSHYDGLSPADGWVPFLGAGSHIAINVLRYTTLPVVALLALVGSERRKIRPEQVLALCWLARLLAYSGRMTVLYVSMLNAGWCLIFVMVLSWLPRRTYLGLGLAGMEICGWGLRAYLRGQLYRYPIQTRIGTYYTLNPGEAQGEAVLRSWVQELLPPQTPVLCFPYAANVYTLYQLKNPSRNLMIPPGSTNPDVYPRVQREIKEKNVKWLIYLEVDAQDAAVNYNVPAEKLIEQWTAVRQQLTQGYSLVRGNAKMGLYSKDP